MENNDFDLKPISSNFPPDPYFEKVFEVSENLLDLGLHKIAVNLLKDVIKIDETNPRGFFILGKAYSSSGDIKNAEKYLRKALSINPHDSKTVRFLGNFLIEQNKKIEGSEFLQKYFHLGNWDSIDEINTLFEISQEVNNLQIEETLQLAWKKSLNSTVGYYYGLYLKNSGDYENASKVFDLISINNGNSIYWNQAGICYLKLSEFDKAIVAFQNAIKNSKSYVTFPDGSDIDAYYTDKSLDIYQANLAHSYNKLNQPERAIDQLDLVINNTNDIYVLSEYIETLFKLERYQEIIDLLKNKDITIEDFNKIDYGISNFYLISLAKLNLFDEYKKIFDEVLNHSIIVEDLDNIFRSTISYFIDLKEFDLVESICIDMIDHDYFDLSSMGFVIFNGYKKLFLADQKETALRIVSRYIEKIKEIFSSSNLFNNYKNLNEIIGYYFSSSLMFYDEIFGWYHKKYNEMVKQLIDTFPNSAELIATYSFLLIKDKNPYLAKEYTLKGLNLPENNYISLFKNNLAYLELVEGNIDKASSLLQEAYFKGTWEEEENLTLKIQSFPPILGIWVDGRIEYLLNSDLIPINFVIISNQVLIHLLQNDFENAVQKIFILFSKISELEGKFFSTFKSKFTFLPKMIFGSYNLAKGNKFEAINSWKSAIKDFDEKISKYQSYFDKEEIEKVRNWLKEIESN